MSSNLGWRRSGPKSLTRWLPIHRLIFHGRRVGCAPPGAAGPLRVRLPYGDSDGAHKLCRVQVEAFHVPIAGPTCCGITRHRSASRPTSGAGHARRARREARQKDCRRPGRGQTPKLTRRRSPTRWAAPCGRVPHSSRVPVPPSRHPRSSTWTPRATIGSAPPPQRARRLWTCCICSTFAVFLAGIRFGVVVPYTTSVGDPKRGEGRKRPRETRFLAAAPPGAFGGLGHYTTAAGDSIDCCSRETACGGRSRDGRSTCCASAAARNPEICPRRHPHWASQPFRPLLPAAGATWNSNGSPARDLLRSSTTSAVPRRDTLLPSPTHGGGSGVDRGDQHALR